MPVSSLFHMSSTVRTDADTSCFLEKYTHCSLFRTPVLAVPKHPGARGCLESEGRTGGTCVPSHGSAVEKDSWALLQPRSQYETHTTWLAIFMCVYDEGVLIL